MLPTKSQVEVHTRKMVSEMTKFAKERFGIPTLAFDLKFNHRDGGNSRAVFTKDKRYFISIAPYELYTFPVKGMREYKSFAWQHEHGSFATSDWQVWLDAVIAHEVSHIIQFWMKRNESTLKMAHTSDSQGNYCYQGLGRAESGHGEFFQSIYRIMRIQFVNDRIERMARGVTLTQDFDRPKKEPVVVKDNRVCVITGKVFTINGRQFQVVGFNPNPKKRLYCYQAKELMSGRIYSVKLGDILRTIEGGSETVLKAHPSLAAEAQQFNRAQVGVRQATATRRRRRRAW